jgi:hypothetical protein
MVKSEESIEWMEKEILGLGWIVRQSSRKKSSAAKNDASKFKVYSDPMG